MYNNSSKRNGFLIIFIFITIFQSLCILTFFGYILQLVIIEWHPIIFLFVTNSADVPLGYCLVCLFFVVRCKNFLREYEALICCKLFLMKRCKKDKVLAITYTWGKQENRNVTKTTKTYRLNHINHRNYETLISELQTFIKAREWNTYFIKIKQDTLQP